MATIVPHPAFDLGWMNNLTDVVLILQGIHPDMTLNQLLVLLLVATNPGITQRDIMDKAGLADSSASRIVAMLSDHGSRGSGPFYLIEATTGLGDRRHKPLRLTKKGQGLITRLASAMARGAAK